MKAITYSEYGDADVLRINQVDQPQPSANEVLVRVRAAEVTKSDCEMRSFNYSVKWFWLPLRIVFGISRPKRQILGGYFAGEIAAVGSAVSTFKVGDPVFGSAQLKLGAYGEYMTLPASYTVAAKPHNMTFTEAAAVPLGGLNALHFMHKAGVGAGEQVLINGAGGSIGAHAVQIAKALGATVTGVDTAAKEQFVRTLGADEFVNYKTQDFTATAQRYDVIFDMVPDSNYTACIGLLTHDGRYFHGNPRVSTMLRTFLTNRTSKKRAGFAFARETIEELTTLKEMIEQGHVRSIVGRTVAPQEIAQAHRWVETEQRVGAVVLKTEF